MSNTKKRHMEEITVIQSIFCEDICDVFSNGPIDIECIFDIQPILPKKEFQIFYIYQNSKNLKTPVDFGSIFVEYLPMIRFYVKFPSTYPKEKAPDFSLKIPWLTPWDSSKICQKLDELWIENEGSEIIFVWIDFLKNRLFDFLNMKEKLDISYLFSYNKDKDDYHLNELMKLKDKRVSKPIDLFIIEFIKRYDTRKQYQRFQKILHFCEICLEQKLGIDCLKLGNCKHVFCKNCINQYLKWKILDGNVTRILCPINNCSKEIEFEDIQKICDKKMFKRFEELLLKKAINTMKDVIPCARKLCQYPVIIEGVEDNLATCANCEYNFCIYCRKGYHGVTPCEMTKKEVKNLIEKYQNSSKEEKKLLELRHGKKQIQNVVERFLTQEYLKKNTKPCPNCCTQTTKIDGCNKMTCSYCQKNFCWLCGYLIELKNPYEHYRENIYGINICGGRLFDGVIPKDDFLDDIEIEANFQFFQNG